MIETEEVITEEGTTTRIETTIAIKQITSKGKHQKIMIFNSNNSITTKEYHLATITLTIKHLITIIQVIIEKILTTKEETSVIIEEAMTTIVEDMTIEEAITTIEVVMITIEEAITIIEEDITTIEEDITTIEEASIIIEEVIMIEINKIIKDLTKEESMYRIQTKFLLILI